MVLGPRGVSWAQLWLTILFVVGYFGVLYVLLVGKAAVDDSHSDTLHALLGVLTATVVQVMGYWFARQRPGDTLASEVKKTPWFKRRPKHVEVSRSQSSGKRKAR